MEKNQLTKHRGRFLTIEGTEGVGKTTNIRFIQGLLEQNNIKYIHTREPGGTPLAEELRNILLANREENFNSTAELLVMFAARAQHLSEVIIPALDDGVWVLCDRFTDATFAYQGYGRELDLTQIELLEKTVQNGLHPDKTFYLDIDVTVGLERAKARGELDRFEKEHIAFFERVRNGYLKRVADNPNRYFVIDAGQELEGVQNDIAEKMKTLIHSFNVS